MSTHVEQMISRLITMGKIGASFGDFQVFGQLLVRPFDLSFELRRAEAGPGNLLKLTFAVNPMPGVESSLAELVIDEPRDLEIDDERVVFAKARYVRFEETTFVVRGNQVHRASMGVVERSDELPTEPAIALR